MLWVGILYVRVLKDENGKKIKMGGRSSYIQNPYVKLNINDNFT